MESTKGQNPIGNPSDATETDHAKFLWRKRGPQFIVIGIVLLMGSMLTSLCLDYSHPAFHYVLYGVTSLGALSVLAGLVLVLGF